MHTTEIELEREKADYGTTGHAYVCQICGYKIETRPPEWCPQCRNHRALFKRTPL